MKLRRRPTRRRPRVPRVEHPDINSRGGSRRWTVFKNQVVREEPICWLRFPKCTIHSETADHIIPRKFRSDLAFVRSNARGACNYCNRARGATPAHALPELRKRLEAEYRQKVSPPKALGFFR